MAKQYLDIRQEAERVKISVPTLERMVAKGDYPSIKLGKLRRFDPEMSDRHLAQMAVGAGSAKAA